MAPDFIQVLAKVRWANQQSTSLYHAVAEYIDTNPYVPVIEDRPESQAYRVTVHLTYPPPPRIALIFGDFLNTLHSVLDHTAWQLLLREGTKGDRRTYFPIYDVEPEREGTKVGVNILDALDRPAIKDAAVLAALDAVQPYKYLNSPLGPPPKFHPLSVLKKLNRESKHRHIPLLASTVRVGRYAYPNEAISTLLDKRVLMINMQFGPLKDGDELAWIPYSWAGDHGLPAQADLQAQVAPEEMAEPLRDRTLIDIANGMFDYVTKQVFPRFAPFFEFAGDPGEPQRPVPPTPLRVEPKSPA